MEVDSFLYGAGIFSDNADSCSQSETTTVASAVSGLSSVVATHANANTNANANANMNANVNLKTNTKEDAQITTTTTKTPRKFGRDLTRSSLGNSSKKDKGKGKGNFQGGNAHAVVKSTSSSQKKRSFTSRFARKHSRTNSNTSMGNSKTKSNSNGDNNDNGDIVGRNRNMSRSATKRHEHVQKHRPVLSPHYEQEQQQQDNKNTASSSSTSGSALAAGARDGAGAGAAVADTIASPKRIRSRFSRSRHNHTLHTARNLELEGTLRKAEMSVKSALEFGQERKSSNLSSGLASTSNGNTSSNINSNASGSGTGERRTRFATSSPTLVHTTPSSNGDAKTPVNGRSPRPKGMEYTVQFEAGPIGIKLEPVIKNGKREFGCRVMKFVQNQNHDAQIQRDALAVDTDKDPSDKSSSPSPPLSQAMKAGKISVGDVITSVNGINVTSNHYKDIVALLTAAKEEERRITFRIPRSPAAVMPTTPATAKKRIKMKMDEAALSSTRSKTTRSISDVLSSQPASKAAATSIVAPKTPTPSSSLSLNPSKIFAKDTTPPTFFSPSFVKKMTQSTVKDRGTFFSNTSRHPHPLTSSSTSAAVDTAMATAAVPTSKPPSKSLSDVLSTVMKNVAPDMSMNMSIMSNSSTNVVPAAATAATSTSVSGILSRNMGKVFAGAPSSEFNETVHAKMELLTELSEAKASLGEQETSMKMMTKIMDDLHKEKVHVEAEKESLRETLAQAQTKKELSEVQVEELKKAQCRIEETTARVNTLAKQNGSLRAQYEQLKVQFNGKESEYNRQIKKLERDYAESMQNLDELDHMATTFKKQLAEKDRKLDTISRELLDRTMQVDKLETRMNKLDLALAVASGQASEAKTNTDVLEATYQEKIAALEEDLKVQAKREKEEVTRLRDLLLVGDNEKDLLQRQMEYAVDQVATMAEGHQEERQGLLKQLEDSKQIIESTSAGLHDKLNSALEEIEQRKVSEQQLLAQMAEREQILRAQIEEFEGQVEDATTKASVSESNFQQIQQCLFETTEKSKALEEQLSDSEKKVEESMESNKVLLVERDTLKSESQKIRLELSGLQRAAASKEQHLSTLLEEQRRQFSEEAKDLAAKLEASDSEASLMSQIMSELSESKSDREMLQVKVATLTDTLQLVEEKREDLVKENSSLAEQVETKAHEVKRWMETSRISSEEVNRLNLLLEEEKVSWSALSEKMEVDMRELCNERDALKDEIERASTSTTAEKVAHESKLKLLNEELHRLEKSAEECKSADGSLTKTNLELEENLRITKQELLEQSQSASHKLLQQSKKHEEIVNVMQRDYSDSFQEKENFIIKLQEEIEEKQAKIEKMSMDMENTNNDRIHLEEALELLKVEKDKLAGQVASLEDELLAQKGQHESIVRKLQAEAKKYSQELLVQQGRATDLLTKADVRNQDEIEKTRKFYIESSMEKQQQVENMEEEIREKENVISELQKEIKIKEDSYNVLACDLKNSVDAKFDVESKLLLVEKQLQTLKDELNALSSETIDKTKNFDCVLKEKEDLIAKFNHQAMTLTEEKEALCSELNSLKKEQVKHQQIHNTDLKEMQMKLVDLSTELSQQQAKANDILSNEERRYQERFGNLQEMFRQSVAEKEGFIEKLQKEIEEKQDCMDALAVDCQTITHEKEQSEGKLEVLQTEVSSLKDQIASSVSIADTTNQKLSVALKEKEVFIADLTEQVAAMKMEGNNLKEKLLEVSSEKDTLSKELRSLKAAMATLEYNHSFAVRDLESKLSLATDEIELQKSRSAKSLAQSDSKNQERFTRMQKLFSESVAEKEGFIEKVQKEIEDKQDRLESVLLDRQRATDEKEQAESKLSLAESNVAALREQLAKNSTERENYREADKAMVMKLENELDSVSKQRDELIQNFTQQVESMQSTESKLQQDLEAMKLKKENLELELAQAQSDLLSAQKKFDTSVKELEASLKSAATDALTEKARNKEALDKVVERMTYNQKMFSDSATERDEFIDKLQKEIEDKQDTIDLLRSDLEVTSCAKDKVVEERKHLVVKLQSSQDSLQKINSKLDEEMKKSDALNATLLKLKSSDASTKTEIERLESEVRLRRNQIDEIEEAYKLLVDDSAKQIYDFELELKDSEKREEAERAKLLQNLDDANAAIQSCREEMNVLKKSLTEKDESFALNQEKVAVALKEKESKIEKLEKESRSIQNDLNSSNAKNEKLEERIQHFTSTLKDSELLVSSLRETLQVQETESSMKDDLLQGVAKSLAKTCNDLKLKGAIEPTENSVESIENFVRCLQEAVKDNESNALAGFELAKSRERAVQRLERTLNAKERDIQGLHKDVGKFKSIVSELKSEQKTKIESIQSEMADIEHRRIVAEDLNRGLCEEKAAMESQMAKNKVDFKEIRDKLDSANTTIEEYELKLMILREGHEVALGQTAIIEQLEVDLEDVSSEVESLVTRNEHLENELDRMAENLKLVQNSEQSAIDKCSELEIQLKEQLAHSSNFEYKNTILLNDNVCLLSDLEKASTTTEQLKQNLLDLEDNMKEDKSSFESELALQRDSAAQLAQQVESLHVELDKKVDEVKTLNLELSTLQKSTKTLEKNLQNSEVAKVKSDMAREETELAATEALDLLDKKDGIISQLQESIEKRQTSIVDLQSKIERKEAELLTQSLEAGRFAKKEALNQVQQNRFRSEIESKTEELKQLKKNISSLNDALLQSRSKIVASEKKRSEESKKFSEDINTMKSTLNDTKTKLYGAEKLINIHDKECTRMLNDVEIKQEQIESLSTKIQDLESDKEEMDARMNEIEASLGTQKDIISTLELELSNKNGEIEELRDACASTERDSEAILNLNAEISSLESKLDEREEKLQNLLLEAESGEQQMLHLEERLRSSEEEAKLLCETVEEKEREISEIQKIVTRISTEKSEVLALLSRTQDRLKDETETGSDHQLRVTCFDDDHDNDTASLGLSRASLSPTTSDIVSKHSELLEDLCRMKSAIHDAISPCKSLPDDSVEYANGPIVKMLQEELDEKNKTLLSMENKVDTLMSELSVAGDDLKKKESYVKQLSSSMKGYEKQHAELKKKLSSRKAYVVQLEEALSHEVKHRREIESLLTAAQREKKSLASDYDSKIDELASAQKEIEMKSHAVQEQRNVARQLAKQLHTTKQKIFALKAHLQSEGLLKKEGSSVASKNRVPAYSPMVPIPKHPTRNNVPDLNTALSNDSIEWRLSEDEDSP